MAVGTPWAQIDIQVEKDPPAFLLRGRTTRDPLHELSELDLAAVGLAGMISQELYRNSELDNPTLFDRSTVRVTFTYRQGTFRTSRAETATCGWNPAVEVPILADLSE